MNRSTNAFRFGAQKPDLRLRIRCCFSVASNERVNFVSRSCCTFRTRSPLFRDSFTNLAACSTTQASFGFNVAGEITTWRDFKCKNTRTNAHRTPCIVKTRCSKKSHCQSETACRLRNASHVPAPRRGSGSKPCSRRIRFTVFFDNERIPSFFSSPRMRV